MIKLPKIDSNFEKLYRIIIGSVQSKLMLAGIELKIFNHLSRPCTARHLSEIMNTHPENTQRFLDGLTACDLLFKKNAQYWNTRESQAFLVEESPAYIGRTLVFSATFNTVGLENLPDLIRNGPPRVCHDKNPALEERFHANGAAAMGALQMAGFAQIAVDVIMQLPEFPFFKKMLDLGGGPGLIGMSIIDSHPDMTGVIFDIPPVIKETQKFIEKHGMEDRITSISGDFRYDSIGDKYDLIWASGTLDFAKEDTSLIINKIHNALNPKGVFVSFHDGLTGERTRPELMVLTRMSASLAGQNFGFDKGVIADSMLKAGFKSVRSFALDTPLGPIDLDIGRK